MNALPDDLNYCELKAELRILQTKIDDLNARLNRITPAVPSACGRRFAKVSVFRWQLAVGFRVLAGAVAQTSDPITIGPDGRVRMGKSLDVADAVKAKSFAGDAGGLTVKGDSVAQAVAGEFKGDVEAAGKVKGGLAIEAGQSDSYFTRNDHRHSQLGNATGNAAIESSSNYTGLMILGRSTPRGRFVRMWDNVGTSREMPNQKFGRQDKMHWRARQLMVMSQPERGESKCSQ